MVTYDIFENIEYCLLISMMDLMFSDPVRIKSQQAMVLPIQTPPHRFDDMQKKQMNYQLKKKARKENMRKLGFSATGEFIKVNHKDKKKLNALKALNATHSQADLLEDIKEEPY